MTPFHGMFFRLYRCRSWKIAIIFDPFIEINIRVQVVKVANVTKIVAMPINGKHFFFFNLFRIRMVDAIAIWYTASGIREVVVLERTVHVI